MPGKQTRFSVKIQNNTEGTFHLRKGLDEFNAGVGCRSAALQYRRRVITGEPSVTIRRPYDCELSAEPRLSLILGSPNPSMLCRGIYSCGNRDRRKHTTHRSPPFLDRGILSQVCDAFPSVSYSPLIGTDSNHHSNSQQLSQSSKELLIGSCGA